MAFVEFHGVTKYYEMGGQKIAAADGVDFSVEQGEFAVIVGPSGAGKNHCAQYFGRHRHLFLGERFCWMAGKSAPIRQNSSQNTGGMMWDLFFSFTTWYRT